ncbi:MAG: hypothetical protein GY834_17175 [Bacteroidetes bacterium]|nr:hypothetical protein [Bacteroidota bacterium]
MNRELLNTEKGFTIIEVLVGAFIFMLGFSVLIFLLSRLMVNYSIDEISTANRIAQNHLEVTIATKDTIAFTKNDIVDNVKYIVENTVVVKDNMACVKVNVKRSTKEKVLSKLYYEFDLFEN